jgi:hypothetical protein
LVDLSINISIIFTNRSWKNKLWWCGLDSTATQQNPVGGRGCSEDSSEPLSSVFPVGNQTNSVLSPGKITRIFIILMHINLSCKLKF